MDRYLDEFFNSISETIEKYRTYNRLMIISLVIFYFSLVPVLPFTVMSIYPKISEYLSSTSVWIIFVIVSGVLSFIFIKKQKSYEPDDFHHLFYYLFSSYKKLAQYKDTSRVYFINSAEKKFKKFMKLLNEISKQLEEPKSSIIESLGFYKQFKTFQKTLENKILPFFSQESIPNPDLIEILNAIEIISRSLKNKDLEIFSQKIKSIENLSEIQETKRSRLEFMGGIFKTIWDVKNPLLRFFVTSMITWGLSGTLFWIVILIISKFFEYSFSENLGTIVTGIIIAGIVAGSTRFVKKD